MADLEYFADAPPEQLENVERSAYGQTLRARARQAALATAVLAMRRQELMAAATERAQESFVDGAGQLKMRVDWKTAQMLAVKFGRMDWWHDPEMLRVALRDNPQLRVRCVSPKVTLRVNGLRDCHPERSEGGA